MEKFRVEFQVQDWLPTEWKTQMATILLWTKSLEEILATKQADVNFHSFRKCTFDLTQQKFVALYWDWTE